MAEFQEIVFDISAYNCIDDRFFSLITGDLDPPLWRLINPNIYGFLSWPEVPHGR